MHSINLKTTFVNFINASEAESTIGVDLIGSVLIFEISKWIKKKEKWPANRQRSGQDKEIYEEVLRSGEQITPLTPGWMVNKTTERDDDIVRHLKQLNDLNIAIQIRP